MLFLMFVRVHIFYIPYIMKDMILLSVLKSLVEEECCSTRVDVRIAGLGICLSLVVNY